MKRPSSWLIFMAVIALAGCASRPVPPEWQSSALGSVKGFTAAYLEGNTKVADFEFGRAKADISATGRLDLIARAELVRCAVRVASLEFDNCAGYEPLAQDARAPEQAYAAFLSGRWSGLDAALLPAQHRAIVVKAATGPDRPLNAAPTASMLSAMEDPLARLVAAGALLQNARLTVPDIEVATETASSQGWRRPLLAWLGVQLKRAQDASEQAAAARLQRRIDLVLQLPTPKMQ